MNIFLEIKNSYTKNKVVDLSEESSNYVDIINHTVAIYAF